MKKENFWTRCLKRFYGIRTLDEYRKSELNRINSQALMLLYAFYVFANLLFLILVSINTRIAAWTMFIVNLLIFVFILPLYIIWQSRKAVDFREDTIYENQADYDKQAKKFRKNAMFGILLFTLLMYLIIPLSENGKDYWSIIFSPKHIITSIISGLVWRPWCTLPSNPKEQSSKRKIKNELLE